MAAPVHLVGVRDPPGTAGRSFEDGGNATIIRVLGAADGSPTPHDGRYVTAWDWNTNAGTLSLTSTANRDEAARFSTKDALKQWRRVSRVEPRRPWDGKPNRPLTALTVELVHV